MIVLVGVYMLEYAVPAAVKMLQGELGVLLVVQVGQVNLPMYVLE